MTKITDIFNTKEKTFSFELFPPKTEQGYQNLLATIEDLSALSPDFISCTYGAGGGNRGKTLDIAEHIEKNYNIPAVAHLTCVLHTKEEIRSILKDIQSRGIQNVLALRGDPPQDRLDWKPGEQNFQQTPELCRFIREEFPGAFNTGVAAFPEGHALRPTPEQDIEITKQKILNGANFIITQLFFDNQDYFRYVELARKNGITARIIPGIIPITNYDGILKFANTCGSRIPDEIKEIFEPIREDKEATRQTGKEFAIRQCRELLDKGAPGLHFFSLNKLQPTKDILEQVRKD